jgi:cytidine deaminase
MTDEELLIRAVAARRAAYAPYSHFAVGAAVLAVSGKVYTGANVENASFGLTVCAERVAMWRAVSAGEREIRTVAVATADGATPCGACRQVLAEFAPQGHDLSQVRVLVGDLQGRWRAYTLAELLPEAFTPEKLPAPRKAPAPGVSAAGPEGSR